MFRPSINGFHFSNSDWPETPLLSLDVPLIGRIGIGDAGNGLCGGMAYAASDFWRSGLPVPETVNNPTPDSPLFRYIVRRFIDSVDAPMGILRAYGWMAHPGNLAARTWDELTHCMWQLNPVPITVILTHSVDPLMGNKNHQVLVYGHEADRDLVKLKVYDNNYPDDDDQWILCTREAVTSSAYDSIRGLYANHYRPLHPEFD